MLEILLGQIPEAIYFALFMIFTKRLKDKRLLFIFLMTIEYLILTYFIKFNIWIQVIYTFMTYVILKILYKEKAQITDIFTFTIGSFILILSSIFCFIISQKNIIIATILNRVLLFSFLFLFRNKLNNIQKIYKTLWNRNDKIKKKIKTTTFRSLNIVIFNIIFYGLNSCILYAIYYNSIKK